MWYNNIVTTSKRSHDLHVVFVSQQEDEEILSLQENSRDHREDMNHGTLNNYLIVISIYRF